MNLLCACGCVVKFFEKSPDAAGEGARATSTSCSALYELNFHGLVVKLQVVVLPDSCHGIFPPLEDHLSCLLRAATASI